MVGGGEAMVERSAEREAIREAVAGAAAGRGKTLVVTGAAGIGKTSLLRDLRAQAERASLRVLRAAGAPLESAFSFGVATQLLADAAAAEPEPFAGAAELARHLFDIDASGPAATPGEDTAFLGTRLAFGGELAEALRLAERPDLAEALAVEADAEARRRASLL